MKKNMAEKSEEQRIKNGTVRISTDVNENLSALNNLFIEFK